MAADISGAGQEIYSLQRRQSSGVPTEDRSSNGIQSWKEAAAISKAFWLWASAAAGRTCKLYDVKYAGAETVNGSQTAKVELVPKSAKLRNNIASITLWIDPTRGPVQQKIVEPSGDYRLAKYSDIQLNQKLPDGAFKLKTTGKTKTISPQG
jgi:hypothetical protein